MAWTTPRTWTDGEVVTASIMNTHVRDNMNILKTPRDDFGKLANLSSTTLADLSSTNVTGLARPGTTNTFTAGLTRFTGLTARCRVPVGADKWTGTKGVDAKGVWVEGDYLHHIAFNFTTEYRYLGTFISTPAGALSGSVWIEGENLHYISATGDERRVDSLGATGTHSDAGAREGSSWVETYVHWIQQGGVIERPGHADIVHGDGIQHSDVHGDFAHIDNHGDTGHADSHGDVAHSDSHNDIPHEDHQDFSDFPKHLDIAHSDTHSDVSHSDSHSDTSHSDSHNDVAHNDTHSDHTDHNDVAEDTRPVVV